MIETPRLLLRITTIEAYRQAFQVLDDADLMQWLGMEDPALLASEKNKIAGGMTTYRTSLRFIHLIERQSGKVAGSFAYHNWYPAHSRSEIGYAMSADRYKNLGYMKEAMPLLIRYGFEEMALHRMEAYIHPDNEPSRRLVSGVGFREEGLLRDHYIHNGQVGDSLVYGLLRSDFEAHIKQ